MSLKYQWSESNGEGGGLKYQLSESSDVFGKGGRLKKYW